VVAEQGEEAAAAITAVSPPRKSMHGAVYTTEEPSSTVNLR
jgi:hypothetical protein